LASLSIVDIVLLFTQKRALTAERNIPIKLSNSDDNLITIDLTSRYPFAVKVMIIDETPPQLQLRKFKMETSLSSGESKTLSYTITPKERGVYHFNRINCYISTKINLVEREIRFEQAADTKAYPSFIQMRKYELLAINNRLADIGINKQRSIGKHTEFDMIKEYTLGDDYRSINWRATARKGNLMVNKYLEEKSQHVYSIIDKGRLMQFPFDGVTLLDYAINSTLALSNIATIKDDKCGLITFNKEIDSIVLPDKKRSHIQLIMENLYHLDTTWLASNFELLYITIKRKIPQRSMLMLYTNFESLSSLNSVLPYLRLIAKQHLLVVVLFENTEVKTITSTRVGNIEDFYTKTIAEKYMYEKRQMASSLRKNGMIPVLAPPQNITTSVINRYLEIKAESLL
jgi:Uncharacterized conserved protein (some members contain a von Willebrand factor type A (vWA) domain)